MSIIATGHVFIIAEAGVNHNGRVEDALRMVEAAARAGADAVKFQTFKAERLVSASAPKAEYQKLRTDASENQLEMLRRLELDHAAHEAVAARCREHDILFLSSPFDEPSVDELAALGVPLFKIPSGEITNLPLLRKIGGMGREVILSTGMSTLDEVRDAAAILRDAGLPDESLTVLQCNTEYPTPFEQVNLRAMRTLQRALDVRVGYSDHTVGIEACIAATALGAQVLEKHFTLDRSRPGPDHAASLEPDELSAMIAAVRNVEAALGTGEKRPSPSERKNLHIARKYLVASRPIAAGETFSPQNLTAKRIGVPGISPMLWDELIGSPAPQAFKTDEPIRLRQEN